MARKLLTRMFGPRPLMLTSCVAAWNAVSSCSQPWLFDDSEMNDRGAIYKRQKSC